MVEGLGKIERLNPHDVWRNEATHFTPWLEEHIDLLADAVGVDSQDVEREAAIGNFSADLVGGESGSSRPVVIENQLEQPNHDHLGKLMTYAAGKGAGVIIWVSPKIRSEHRSALEWLNNATQGNIDFFGVEVEVLKIGDSQKAPNFKVVVAPERSAIEPGDSPASERSQRYQTFFETVLNQIKVKRPGITRAAAVGFRHWLDTPSGTSGFKFRVSFASKSRFRVELYIDTSDLGWNKQVFDALYADKIAIQEELGTQLSWERLDTRKASRVAWYWDKSVTVMDTPEKLEELKQWVSECYFKFRDGLAPYLDAVSVEQ